MGVVTPDITKQTAEVTREQDAQNQRFADLLKQSLQTIQDQYGTSSQEYADELKRQNDLIAQQGAQQKAVDDQTAQAREDELTFQQGQAKNAQDTADLNSANARDEAEFRRKQIADSQGRIKDAFKGYDDDYYNNYAKSIVDANEPALLQKYDDIQRDSALGHGSKGTLVSSSAVRDFGKIAGQKATEEANVAKGASDSATSLRNQVNDQFNTQMSAALQAATLTPFVPLQGTVGAGGPKPTSAVGNATGDTSKMLSPSFKMTAGDMSATPAAKVDPTLKGPGLTPGDTPPSDDPPMQSVYIEGVGNIQIPNYGIQAAAAAKPATGNTGSAVATQPMLQQPDLYTGQNAQPKPVEQQAVMPPAPSFAAQPPAVEKKSAAPAVKVV